MDYCSYFIKDKALFGSNPSQKSVKELEDMGVKYFIDLTCEGENKVKPYITQYTYIRYPLIDHKVPVDLKSFSKFILRLSSIIEGLDNGEKIYINCKAGIGRSGLVSACLLCYIKELSHIEAIEITTNCHRNRTNIKEKLKKLTSPQTISQKNFVKKFFENMYFYRAYKHINTVGFSNFSLHTVYIKDIGTFPTSESAIQAYKDINNKEYVKKQLASKTPTIAKKLGKSINSKFYEENKHLIMESILLLKFNQHPEIKENLLNTGLRIIISSDTNDSYWGIGKDLQGNNMLGKILMKLRKKFYEEN